MNDDDISEKLSFAIFCGAANGHFGAVNSISWTIGRIKSLDVIAFDLFDTEMINTVALRLLLIQNQILIFLELMGIRRYINVP